MTTHRITEVLALELMFAGLSAGQSRLDAPAKSSEETIEGNIVLDSNGEALVELPPAFETLHRLEVGPKGARHVQTGRRAGRTVA